MKLSLRANQQDSVDIPEPTTEVLQHQVPNLESTPPQDYGTQDSNGTHEQQSIPTQTSQDTNNIDYGEESSDPDAFRFYSPELEPKLPKDIEHRAKEAIEDLFEEVDLSPKPVALCCRAAVSCCERVQPRRLPGDHLVPQFSPLLKKASSQGAKAMVAFLSPSFPRLLRDVWVLAELAITVYQFVLACVSLSENRTEAFNIVYVALAGFAMFLSIIDVMVHCIQLGSFASIVLYIRSKLTSRPQKPGNKDPEEIQKCCLFSKLWRKRFNTSIELIRNIISELILYPLLICDFFDFIGSGSFRREDRGERIEFSLFVVGGFYLVLSVYIARMLMIALSLFSLRRIPSSSSNTQQTYVKLMIKFGVHIMAQLILSVVIIAALGFKIRQENPAPCDGGDCSVNASWYLIVAIAIGGLLPLLGIFSFFFTNMYKVREMSVALWIDMMSLLQGESFTSVVFAKEGIQKAKSKAKHFAEKVQLVQTRKEFKELVKSMPSWAKRLYPLRFPVFWIFGIFYALLLGLFGVTLFLSQPEEDFGTDFFEQSFGLVAMIAVAFLVIANIHLLFLVTILLLIIAVVVLLVILSPAFLVLALILYVPLGCLWGCLDYTRSLAKEMSVFSNPSVHPSRVRDAIQKTRRDLHK